MLKLEVLFGKTVPIPGQDFSSQRFHASVQLELADNLATEQLRVKIADAFSTVKQTVEDQVMASSTAIKAKDPVKVGQTVPGQRETTHERASTRQIGYITALADEAGISISELNRKIFEEFGVKGLYDLSKHQASRTVDMLRVPRKKAA